LERFDPRRWKVIECQDGAILIDAGTTCALYCDQKAGYFAEFQLLALDDADDIAETDRAVYGWWGPCCAGCLRRVQEMPELIWLEAIPLSDVVVISKGRGHHEYHRDWHRATIRVGSRVPSRAIRALIAACDPAHPRVTPREALERLAVLRLLQTSL
jgi:hypothetical protein